MTNLQHNKWKEYMKNPWIISSVFFILTIIINKLEISLGGLATLSRWICLSFSFLFVIILTLKQIFEKKYQDKNKTWFKILKILCSPFEKNIWLFYGISFSIIFFTIINSIEIESHISKNTHLILTNLWVQVLISIIILIIYFLSSKSIYCLSKWNKKRNDKKEYYNQLEIDNKNLLKEKECLSKEKNEFFQQNEQLSSQITDLKTQLSTLNEKIILLAKEKCKNNDCDKYKIIKELTNYQNGSIA